MSLFTPVTRERTKLRMALAGVSGGGKTIGALYIAYGLTGDWGKIALLDTEHKRAKAYANRSELETGAFLYASLEPPYSVERYLDYAKDAAAAVGPDGVLIVDSFSHAWKGQGGVLDYKSTIASRPGKNDYSAWDEAGKAQNNLIDTLFDLDCHLICTMRVKQDYAMELNERGKQQPVKLGLAPVQRDDTEYEFDIMLNIDRSHIATASKDITFLDGYEAVITPQLGRDLREWLYKGKEPVRLVCTDCRRKIRDSRQKDGTLIPAVSCAALAEEKVGRRLCKECLLKAMKAGKEDAHDSGKAAAEEPQE